MGEINDNSVKLSKMIEKAEFHSVPLKAIAGFLSTCRIRFVEEVNDVVYRRACGNGVNMEISFSVECMQYLSRDLENNSDLYVLSVDVPDLDSLRGRHTSSGLPYVEYGLNYRVAHIENWEKYENDVLPDVIES